MPDWPTTYGYNMFTYPLDLWTGGIFYEHSHRLLASFIGFITLCLTVVIWISRKDRPLRIISICSLLAVVVQGILGGLTVRHLLPDYLSISHAVLAQTFLLLTVWQAYLFMRPPISTKWQTNNPIFIPALLLLIVVYLQLFAGAAMRHGEAGLAIPDFPTMAGSYIPSLSAETIAQINSVRAQIGLRDVSAYQVFLHLLHRFGAVLVVTFVIIFLITFFKLPENCKKNLRKLVFLLASILPLQFLLGVLSVLTKKAPFLTSVHVVTGAGMLALVFLILLKSVYRSDDCKS